MKVVSIAIILTVTAGLTHHAYAAAPQQLWNKSINISVGVHTPAVGTDGSRSTARLIKQTYYVSSQGRIFNRVEHFQMQGGTAREKSERSPGSKGISFAGNAIVATVALVSGAGQIRVTFDGAYRTCNVDVIIGNVGSKPVTYVGFNGIKYTTTDKPVITNPTCAIAEGNALAG
jgi:hypothetical protein